MENSEAVWKIILCGDCFGVESVDSLVCQGKGGVAEVDDLSALVVSDEDSSVVSHSAENENESLAAATGSLPIPSLEPTVRRMSSTEGILKKYEVAELGLDSLAIGSETGTGSQDALPQPPQIEKKTVQVLETVIGPTNSQESLIGVGGASGYPEYSLQAVLYHINETYQASLAAEEASSQHSGSQDEGASQAAQSLRSRTGAGTAGAPLAKALQSPIVATTIGAGAAVDDIARVNTCSIQSGILLLSAGVPDPFVATFDLNGTANEQSVDNMSTAFCMEVGVGNAMYYRAPVQPDAGDNPALSNPALALKPSLGGHALFGFSATTNGHGNAEETSVTNVLTTESASTNTQPYASRVLVRLLPDGSVLVRILDASLHNCSIESVSDVLESATSATSASVGDVPAGEASAIGNSFVPSATALARSYLVSSPPVDAVKFEILLSSNF